MSPSSTTNFLTCRSTHVVTILRLVLILLPHLFDFDALFPRNWLYSPALISVLVRPHHTLSHVSEAHAIRQLSGGKFADAYNAKDTIRLPPLVLAGMGPILELSNPELYLSLILLIIDFLIGYMIESIGLQLLFSNNPLIDKEEREQAKLPEEIRPQNSHIFPIYRKDSKDEPLPLFSMDSLPILAAQLYYWSPATAMSGGVYQCFQNLVGFFLVAGLYNSCQPSGSYPLSAFFLAVAAYIEPHHVVFLIPLNLLLSQKGFPSKQVQVTMLVFFVFWSFCLQGLSYALLGPIKYWDTLFVTYGSGWKNLGPNLSLQWYFHMQVFSRFRNYFETILTGLPYTTVAPLAIRLYQYPMVLVSVIPPWLLWIWTHWKPSHQSLLFLPVCGFFFRLDYFSPNWNSLRYEFKSLLPISLPTILSTHEQNIILCFL